MNFGDERYVRLFIRDTARWLRLPWQARALFPLLLRKVDRAGILELEEPVADLAALVGLPEDIVAAGLPALLSSETVKTSDASRDVTSGHAVTGPVTLVVPNFLHAQTVAKSDRLRQEGVRERRRDEAVKPATPSRPVTSGHNPSLCAVQGSAVQSHAVQDLTEDGPERSETAPDPAPSVTRVRAVKRADIHASELSPAAVAVAAAIDGDESLRPIVERPNELARDLIAAGPGVDVPTEVRKAGAWLRANPTKAKKNGAAFLLRWVSRCQETGGASRPQSGPGNGFRGRVAQAYVPPPAGYVSPMAAEFEARRASGEFDQGDDDIPLFGGGKP